MSSRSMRPRSTSWRTSGVWFKDSPEAAELFRKNGCRVDGGRVRIPAASCWPSAFGRLPDRSSLKICVTKLGIFRAAGAAAGRVPRRADRQSLLHLRPWEQGERNLVETDADDKFLVLDSLAQLPVRLLLPHQRRPARGEHRLPGLPEDGGLPGLPPPPDRPPRAEAARKKPAIHCQHPPRPRSATRGSTARGRCSRWRRWSCCATPSSTARRRPKRSWPRTRRWSGATRSARCSTIPSRSTRSSRGSASMAPQCYVMFSPEVMLGGNRPGHHGRGPGPAQRRGA